jgi:hypothetical protein
LLKPSKRHAGKPLYQTGCSMGCSTWSPETSGYSLYHLRFTCKTALVESRRADSNRLSLLQLGVISQALQGFAKACKPLISGQLSLLGLAVCCTVLRSRWYQSGINIMLASL